jgi:uncharacterized membrane protein SpoIIM required for sporulation
MDERSFVRKRGAAWERLEELLQRAGRRGLRQLPASDLFELGRLYRWTTSDLAYAQGHRFDPGVVHYLNRLTARAHAYVYGSTVETGRARIARFFTQTFPNEARRSWIPIGICIALTVLWASVAYVLVAHDPSTAYALLPDEIIPSHITKSLHDSNFAFTADQSSMMSSLIITNNIRVAYMTFAAGIVTLGAGTIYLIVFNGLMLGGLGALFAHAGFGTDFWVTVAPHGVIELTAIQIAGGAGLLIAAGVLLPGRLRRRDAIAQNSRRAGVLIAGVTAMLCVAGIIEGFFSPLRFSMEVRASVGVITAIGLILYFGFCGVKANRAV